MKPLELALQVATSGGSQVFLGAPWVTLTVEAAPPRWRQRVALEWLALSPHYFFRTQANNHLSHEDFLHSEFRRNSQSRALIVDELVKPYIRSNFTVLDYGCGPGLLAARAAQYAKEVIACDISKGVLACAKALNDMGNIRYLPVFPGKPLAIKNDSVDFVYSFAVIQHVEDAVFSDILRELHRVMKPGALALCHVVLNGAPGWRTEQDWRSDRSVVGRAKWAVAMHCFARDADSIRASVTAAGFEDVVIEPITLRSLQDDIAQQSALRFRKSY